MKETLTLTKVVSSTEHSWGKLIGLSGVDCSCVAKNSHMETMTNLISLSDYNGINLELFISGFSMSV